ncbi:tetratricopeptide repeat protein [Saccharopolyspora sp. TS4A08]|uniref:Tetratricopeptide repeat protein n=1 Tax=Saccharopolyspora ipomoeae TaxID=3042027 RepID=A0ABT6PW89_9PSEU|nr:tetratricopeptide repeat protein [Saccharopolyspora sp. TS4A08]MDI2032284.1 tetratricopeptide repeat protein [Saccharopolyspora sp. TS4A08]
MTNELSGTVRGTVFQIGQVNGSVGVGGHDVIPHDVPVPTGSFFNRVKELRDAAAFLKPATGPARIAMFTGLPGVGKTSVVQRAVDASNDGAYPGGELYVDLGFLRENGTTAVNDGLADCLRSLGVDDKVMPPTFSGRVNHYRSKTRDRAMLVVLDDVIEPAEVAPFVPSAPGSAVLVTSNHQLSELVVDQAEVVPVHPLSDEDGAKLLASLCTENRAVEEPAAIRELAGLCGGLPIALRVAAARLLSHPSLSVSDLVAEIRAENSGLAPFGSPKTNRVASVFTACYNELPDAAARLYEMLGLFPGVDFDRDLILSLGGGTPTELRRALDALLEANLVLDKGRGRYGLHSLVRRHARGAADAAHDAARLRHDVLRRSIAYFLRRCAHADLAVMTKKRLRITSHDEVLAGEPSPFTGEDAKKDALRWMDSERTNLMAVLRAALDTGAHRAAWQLAEAMTALYVNRRYLEDWVEATRIGVRAAQLDDNRQAEARLRSFVSRAYSDLGDLDAAQAALDESLPIAETTGNQRLVASVWELIGRVHDVRGEHESAVAAYRRTIALFEAASDGRGAAFVTYFLGTSLLELGQPDEALETLHHAIGLIQTVPDQRMEGRALTAVGLTHHRLGDIERAVAVLHQAVDLLSRGDDHYYAAHAHEALATVAETIGDAALRRDSLQRAIEIHARFGTPRLEALQAEFNELG